MKFPKFLRIAMAAKTSTIQLNSTTVITKQTFDRTYAKFADIIAKALGFSYQLLAPPDGEIGRELSSGSWTGIIGMIQRNEADMAVSGLSISLQRSKVVKFSYPFQKTRITFATRIGEYKPELTAFLGPYTSEVWILISICLIAMPLALILLQKRKYRFKNFMWYTYGTFVGQALKVHPRKIGDYIMFFCWINAISILGYCYKAVLLSFLSFPPLENVRTIPELANAVANGRYQCTTYPGTYIVGVLAMSTEPNIRIIGESLQRNSGSNDIFAVLNDTKAEKIPTFIGGENHLNPLKVQYIVSEDELIPAFLAIPMRKNFCCKARLDRLIGYIWESGLHRKLVSEEGFITATKSLLHSADVFLKYKERQLSMEDFQGVFITLILGYIASILFFFLEVIVHKHKVTLKFHKMYYKYAYKLKNLS